MHSRPCCWAGAARWAAAAAAGAAAAATWCCTRECAAPRTSTGTRWPAWTGARGIVRAVWGRDVWSEAVKQPPPLPLVTSTIRLPTPLTSARICPTPPAGSITAGYARGRSLPSRNPTCRPSPPSMPADKGLPSLPLPPVPPSPLSTTLRPQHARPPALPPTHAHTRTRTRTRTHLVTPAASGNGAAAQGAGRLAGGSHAVDFEVARGRAACRLDADEGRFGVRAEGGDNDMQMPGRWSHAGSSMPQETLNLPVPVAKCPTSSQTSYLCSVFTRSRHAPLTHMIASRP